MASLAIQSAPVCIRSREVSKRAIAESAASRAFPPCIQRACRLDDRGDLIQLLQTAFENCVANELALSSSDPILHGVDQGQRRFAFGEIITNDSCRVRRRRHRSRERHRLAETRCPDVWP